MLSWFSGGQPASPVLTAEEEHAALDEAMKWTALIMHDETIKAEELLSGGTSPFHKLGRACTLFVRSILGFEKEIAIEALKRLAESEQCAYEHHAAATRDPATAFRSKIYPPGAEYALANAESQCMSAVTGVLTESITETLKGFYKLRKAYATLVELSAAEKKYLDEHFPDRGRKGKAASVRSGQTGAQAGGEDDDDEDAFVDAEDGISDGMAKLAVADTDDDTAFDFRRASTDPVDIFIHSGIAMCFGIFQLVLALLPPMIAKFLAFLSFKGDKQTGLRLLWAATEHKENINGAIAAFVIAIYHNALVAPSDILRRQDVPLARLNALLVGMQPHCEGSGLYTMEWSRMVAVEKDLPRALDIMQNGPKSPLRQVEAFQVFESCFMHMYLHQYAAAATKFEELVALNSWAHGMYYYNAALCHVELYRDALSSSACADAATHAAEFDRLVTLAKANLGTRKILGNRMPLDVWMERKLAKWAARARGGALIDGVGASPVEEITYLWSGYKKMQPSQLEACLARLDWAAPATSSAASTTSSPADAAEPIDEQALRGLIRAAILRHLGRVPDAQAVLEADVLAHSPKALKACTHADAWVGLAGRYERAACAWVAAGGQDGSQTALAPVDADIRAVEKGSDDEADVMLGMKIANARDALGHCGFKA